MRRNQIIAATCLVALLVCPLAASASGLYVPMLGTRAAAMGGAFVGLADDYSAVHYNPAGIYQISGFQTIVSVQDAVPMVSREGRIKFDGATGFSLPVRDVIEATSEVNHYFLPGVFIYSDGGFLSGVVDKVGLCAYTLVDYGVGWAGDKLYDEAVHRNNMTLR